MRILFLTSSFPPEIGAAQTRVHELAVALVRGGHEVRVLTTFPSYPTGILPPEWRGRWGMKHVMDGVRVTRVWSHPAPNSNLLRRMVSNLTFTFTASCAAPFLPRIDVVVVESHPLLNGLAGIVISLAKRVPMVLNVSDLWPENAVQLGVLKNKALISVCRSIARLIHRRAARVLGMTEYIRDKILQEGVPHGKVILFRNSVPLDRFAPSGDRRAMRVSMDMPESGFIGLYAGTFGMCNDVATLVEAAQRIALDDSEIHIVFAGDGAYRHAMQMQVERNKLANVHFLGSVPSNRIPTLLRAADCALISLRDLALLRGTLPRKMFEAMASELPVVFAGEGEAKVVLLEAGAGLCVAPDDAEGISEALQWLKEHPAAARQMGASGRAYVERHFSLERRVQELVTVLNEVCGATSLPGPESQEPVSVVTNHSAA